MHVRLLALLVVLTPYISAMQPAEFATQGLMRRFLGSLPKSYTFYPARWCASSALPPFKGKFVNVESNGLVHIHQPRYPEFQALLKKDDQLYAPVDDVVCHNGKYFRPVGEVKIRDNMPWQAMEEVILEQGVLLSPNPVETRLTSDPYDVVGSDQVSNSPYFSCGRINMFFEKTANDKMANYRGSAAAIDQNLLVTAAHNFLPTVLGDKDNSSKIKATSVKFLHLLTKANNGRTYDIPVVSSHCFIHPKWQSDFDPHYDIAFVFLSHSLNVKPEEKERLLKLHILPPDLEETIRVVGYPLGSDYMQYTKGLTSRDKDAIPLVYHTANTEQGNSGGPIVKGDKSLIGVHTGGTYPGGTHNRGVRIRYDLMPFLEECIASHQMFLEDSDKFLAMQEAKKLAAIAAEEEKLKEKGRVEGEAKGRVAGRIDAMQSIKKALAFIRKGKSSLEIERETGLSITDIDELR